MSEKYGRQTPTLSVILPYTQSHGEQAVQLYNRSGRTAIEWQERLIEDIMAVNSDGLWSHMKFGYAVPRRNGKSEILIMRAVYGITHGERVLFTAHRTATSHSMWEKVIAVLTKSGLTEGEDFKTTKQFGLEHIEMLDSDAVMNFRTRSSKGGLGEGYDLLIIDEAQEYTADQETALKYIVTASENPQTIMCGTPPTAVSAGTVFANYRRSTVMENNGENGWAEWSVQKISAVNDVDLWYEANPSLGYILTERAIRSEIGENELDFNIQRLGYWVEYNQKSAISHKEWTDCQTAEKPVVTKIFFGVKFGKTGNVSLAAAVKMSERIFVEAVDCRPIREGNFWIIPFLLNPHAETVVIDGANGQAILKNDIEQAGSKIKVVLPRVNEIIEANTLFETNLFGGLICHEEQPSLEQAVANCEHRSIGSGGGFGYTSILDGADVSLIEAVSLAHWACANHKEKKKQRIFY